MRSIKLAAAKLPSFGMRWPKVRNICLVPWGARITSLWEEKKTCPNWLGLRSNLRCKRHSSKAPIRKTPTCFHKTHSYFPLQNPSSTVLELLSCTSVHHLFQILGSAPGLMESSHSPWRNSPKNPPHPSCQTCSPSSQGMPPHPFGNHQCLCHPTTRRWPDHPT